MARTEAFDQAARAYDEWFEQHHALYRSELECVRSLLPVSGRGIEIGVGSGRFAAPLGIKNGIEPSPAMRALALEKGIEALDGVAESLPVATSSYDYVLFVTTLCFLDSIAEAFAEAHRILKPDGSIVIALIDRESRLGQEYQQRKQVSRFYRQARFYSVTEVVDALHAAGFDNFTYAQTLYPDIDQEQIQPVTEGYGDGAFVAIRARKSTTPRG